MESRKQVLTSLFGYLLHPAHRSHVAERGSEPFLGPLFFILFCSRRPPNSAGAEYMKLPNFFIVGAPKAGTDDLYYQLDQHPQIYMSPLKEPCFFSSEVRPERFCKELQEAAEANAASLRSYLDSGSLSKRFGGMVSSLDDYQRLFRD
ncbi:MAG TPA: hypothetical protein VHN81_12720, partial [Edaphobacter sp.]|nr:hypothetical protein [Edaphobacter sp.]